MNRTIVGIITLAFTLLSAGATAQIPAPSAARPIRMLVPLGAGTSNDVAARLLAAYLPPILGQPVIVDNKPGGDGVIGTMEIVKSAPNGLNLLAGSISPLASNVAFVKDMPYDPRRDFTPIAGLTQTHWVLLVKPSFPATNMAQFVAAAKQKTSGLSVGYSTTAVQTQIATLNTQLGLNLLPVAYKGTPPTITDVINGSLDATLTDPGLASAQVKGGHLKALAVTSLSRNPNYPDWPAISETVPGYDFRAWNAIVGPVGVPRDFVARFNSAVDKASKMPELIEKYAANGVTPLVLTPEEVRSFIDAEISKWVKLAKAANIQPQ